MKPYGVRGPNIYPDEEGGPNKLLDAKLIFKNTVYLKLAHQLPLSMNEKLEYQHITGNWE
jgi:hypothetical protein